MRRILYTFFSLLLTIALSAQTAHRPKVGLVLGGGGAKGAAEVGALKYIEEAGIPIDYIAGTSIGSIVGGLYACGYRSAQLDSMFRTQDWMTLLGDRDETLSGRMWEKRDGVTYFFGFPVGRRGSALADNSVGMMRGDHVVHLLDSMICSSGTVPCSGEEEKLHTDSISFDSLPIPFRCVATDYINRQEVVLRSGNLAKSMRASMAIPGAFKAIDINGVELLDGGLINNLPVDVVRAMGADVVIAIDLTQNKHEDEDEEERAAENSLFDKAKSHLGQLLRWVKQRPDLKKYKENLQHIDVYINPNLKGFSAASFSEKKVAEMISRGEEAGKAALEDLLRLREQIMQGGSYVY